MGVWNVTKGIDIECYFIVVDVVNTLQTRGIRERQQRTPLAISMTLS